MRSPKMDQLQDFRSSGTHRDSDEISQTHFFA
jgi:hypothetical protein